MEQTLLSEAAKQGIWALLFISLFIYQLKESRRREEDSKKREERLQNFINEMGESLKHLSFQYERLAGDVEDIKDAFPRHFKRREE